MSSKEKGYSLNEEMANSLTHGIGAVLGIIALIILVAGAVSLGDNLKIAGFVIYGGSLILLFLASALYHGVQKQPYKERLRLFDHCAIYVLIAGTYTPFCLVSLKGVTGWALFGAEWACALCGILLTLFAFSKFKKVEVALYLAMGWMAIVAIVPISASLPPAAGLWMLAGGLFYTGGVVFYKWKKLVFNHAIWHLFVLAGAVLHFFGIFFFVLPDSQ